MPEVIDLGLRPYREVYDLQLARVEARQAGTVGDALLMVEHPHVITLGRSRKAEANVVAPGDVEVVQVERGGDVTYHGPGQQVIYPIVQLEGDEQDLHAFLRKLELAMIDALAQFDIRAQRVEGKTGVWVGRRKIASIGVAVRRWVTYHGLALNVTTDLTRFRMINPCGFEAGIMTSMERELSAAPDPRAVQHALVTALAHHLARPFSL